MSIPTAPPSGFRDFLPDQVALRHDAIETIQRIYRSFGFQPVATSAVEDLAVIAVRLATVAHRLGRRSQTPAVHLAYRGDIYLTRFTKLEHVRQIHSTHAPDADVGERQAFVGAEDVCRQDERGDKPSRTQHSAAVEKLATGDFHGGFGDHAWEFYITSPALHNQSPCLNQPHWGMENQ